MVREAQRNGVNFDPVKLRALHCAPEGYGDNKSQRRNTNVPQIIEPSSDSASKEISDDAKMETSKETLGEGTLDLTEFQQKIHLSATKGKMHDVLRFNNGAPSMSVISWNFMEWLPFRRMDVQDDGSWKPISWPLPKGEVRDVPDSVVIHNSVIRRMKANENYRPGNLILGGGGRGVRSAPAEHGMGKWKVLREEGDLIGEVYVRDGKPIGSRTNSGLTTGIKKVFN